MIYTADVGGEVRVTLGGIERQHLSESYRGVHDVIFVDRSFRSMNPPIFIVTKGFRQACTASLILATRG